MAVNDWLEHVAWNDAGLVPAVVQDAGTSEVLMLAWMNRESLERTMHTGQMHYYSRSRGRLWHKGGTSGHVQQLVELRIDCDGDVLLARVQQTGGACHEGYHTCFFRRVEDSGGLTVVAERAFDPTQVYGESRQ